MPSSPYFNAVLSDDPVGYWRMNDPAGSGTVFDSAAVPHHGKVDVHANVVQGGPSPTNFIFDGGSVRNDAVSGGVVLAPGLVLVEPFTIECWVRAFYDARGDQWSFILGGYNGSNLYRVLSLRGESSTLTGVYLSDNQNFNPGQSSSNVLSFVAWHHIVVVVTAGGANCFFYIDGQFDRDAGPVGSPGAQAITHLLGVIIGDSSLVGGVNTQVGSSYTVQQSDQGELVRMTAAGSTVSLPAANTLRRNFTCSLENGSSGVVQVVPVSGSIDGVSSFNIPANQGIQIYSDGLNWFTLRGIAGVSGVNIGGVNAQTGLAYLVDKSDNGKLVTVTNSSIVAPFQVFLQQANVMPAGFFCGVKNLGFFGASIALAAGGLIDGLPSVQLGPQESVTLYSDGTTWWTERGAATGGGVSPQ